MSKYIVVNTFSEVQHGGHIYKEGKPYPAKGKKLDENRANFLTKKHEIYDVAFLEAVKVEEKTVEKGPKVKVDAEEGEK